MQNNVLARLQITGDAKKSFGADSYLNVPLLDENGLLDISFLPEGHQTEVRVVDNIAERLAWTGAQRGCIAIQSDNGQAYILLDRPANDPLRWAHADINGDGGGAGTVDWAGILNKPIVFPPDVHNHALSRLSDVNTTTAPTEGQCLVWHVATSTWVPATITGGGGASTIDWGSVTGKPATYAPTAHTHLITDVTGLQAILDGKATTAALTAHTGDTNNPHGTTKAQVGLANVDNTSDANKPVSTAQQTALNTKVNVSDFNWTNLTGKPTIPAAQVNSDWNSASGVSQILNKPTIPAAQVQSDWNAASGMGVILNKPTIPTVTPQVQPDWNAVTGLGSILNKPTIPTVTPQVQSDWNTATGLGVILNKPTIPAAQVSADWNAASGVTRILNKPTIPTTIDQLTDVDTTTAAPTNGQSLVWNTARGQWIPSTVTGTGTAPVWGNVTGSITDQTDLNTALAGKAAVVHTHAIADTTGLSTALAAKLDTSAFTWAGLSGKPTTFTPSAHTHVVADVTGLQTTLDGKAALVHTHAAADITSGVLATARLGTGTQDTTTYLRGDGTWATVAGGGTAALASSITVAGVTAGSYSTGNVIPASTTLETVLRNMLVVVTPPTYTFPSLSLASSIPTAVTIGNTISPVLTPTYLKNDAGTPPSAYRLKKNGTTIYSSTTVDAYQDPSFVVSGNVAYTCEVDYPTGPIKNDSASNPYPTGRIMSGTKTSNTITFIASTLSKSFWTADTALTPATTSAQVLAFPSSNSSSTNGTSFVINIPIGTNRVSFAYPATLRDVTSVLYTEVMNMDVKGAFDQSLVTVSSVSYKVYTFIAVDPFSATATYTVTI